MIHDKCTKPAGGLAGSLGDVYTKSCLQALPCKDNVQALKTGRECDNVQGQLPCKDNVKNTRPSRLQCSHSGMGQPAQDV